MTLVWHVLLLCLLAAGLDPPNFLTFQNALSTTPISGTSTAVTEGDSLFFRADQFNVYCSPLAPCVWTFYFDSAGQQTYVRTDLSNTVIHTKVFPMVGVFVCNVTLSQGPDFVRSSDFMKVIVLPRPTGTFGWFPPEAAVGGSVLFWANCTSGAGPFGFQWVYNNTPSTRPAPNLYGFVSLKPGRYWELSYPLSDVDLANNSTTSMQVAMIISSGSGSLVASSGMLTVPQRLLGQPRFAPSVRFATAATTVGAAVGLLGSFSNPFLSAVLFNFSVLTSDYSIVLAAPVPRNSTTRSSSVSVTTTSAMLGASPIALRLVLSYAGPNVVPAVYAQVLLTVNPVASITAIAPNVTSVGAPTPFWVRLSGGTAPFNVTVFVLSGPPGPSATLIAVVGPTVSNASVVTVGTYAFTTATATGQRYYVVCVGSDGAGIAATSVGSPPTLTVVPGLTGVVTTNALVTTVSQVALLRANTSGGLPPYSYSWSLLAPSGALLGTVAVGNSSALLVATNITFLASHVVGNAPTNITVRLVMRDSVGATTPPGVNDVFILLNPLPNGGVIDVPSFFVTGVPSNLTISGMTGGTGTQLSYQWVLYNISANGSEVVADVFPKQFGAPGGSVVSTYTASTSLIGTASFGNFALRLTVVDSLGAAAFFGPFPVSVSTFVPSSSPTKSPTTSPTPSVTGTPSVSPTKSVSASVTPTISQSASVTPSVSISASRTPSISLSSSVTPTISLTSSRTPSLSLSGSVTPTLSLSSSGTSSASVTSGLTPTSSVTSGLTPSAASTPSISATASATSGLTPTASVTSGLTPTASSTPTVSVTSGLSPTPTASPSEGLVVLCCGAPCCAGSCCITDALSSPAPSKELPQWGVAIIVVVVVLCCLALILFLLGYRRWRQIKRERAKRLTASSSSSGSAGSAARKQLALCTNSSGESGRGDDPWLLSPTSSAGKGKRRGSTTSSTADSSKKRRGSKDGTKDEKPSRWDWLPWRRNSKDKTKPNRRKGKRDGVIALPVYGVHGREGPSFSSLVTTQSTDSTISSFFSPMLQNTSTTSTDGPLPRSSSASSATSATSTKSAGERNKPWSTKGEANTQAMWQVVYRHSKEDETAGKSSRKDKNKKDKEKKKKKEKKEKKDKKDKKEKDAKNATDKANSNKGSKKGSDKGSKGSAKGSKKGSDKGSKKSSKKGSSSSSTSRLSKSPGSGQKHGDTVRGIHGRHRSHLKHPGEFGSTARSRSTFGPLSPDAVLLALEEDGLTIEDLRTRPPSSSADVSSDDSRGPLFETTSRGTTPNLGALFDSFSMQKRSSPKR